MNFEKFQLLPLLKPTHRVRKKQGFEKIAFKTFKTLKIFV